ncbi:uncharacterized protein RCC_02159 [Ramularia collo-cygni]|uniref:Uncharacterized protein n=1 Tax=Ramularia collo-cygni TaxID=112498 RepID=A0A2D3UVX3_9PEZI|nr:uncharacterized protein RCC_02159 [Ramularia collo-cygni]CZT16317.1 uncharacterized protein RCC_02159 [Ramularia collo-cygni]
MPPRNILLCFDAFGTLFRPRQPIAQQYGEVARSLGLANIKNEDVNKSFKAAFKQESKQNPNYGKQNGLNAEKWWSRIIVNTFTPLIPAGQKLPEELVPKLLHRFWSKEGYVLYPDVLPLLQQLRKAHRYGNARVVVGVITNSDDRVPDILTSLGMKVSPLRFPVNQKLESRDEYDIDFAVMSYDVGFEKPDARMFEAGKTMLEAVIGGSIEDAKEWRKIYVGDEYAKDVVGAVEAGWNAVLVERDNDADRHGVKWLEGEPTKSLYEVFETEKAVGFCSLGRLAQWLPGGRRIEN